MRGIRRCPLGPRPPRVVLPGLLLASALAGLAAPAAIAEGPGAAEALRTWLGPDGHPLPFEDDAEILEFLRAARVVRWRTHEGGLNREQ